MVHGDLECELSAVVVHAAAVHEAEHVPDHVRGEHTCPGDRTHAAAGQTRAQQRQGGAGHLHAARLQHTVLTSD